MAEKPLECSQCQKPPSVAYKEIVNGICTATSMCSDCPILASKLHGSSEVFVRSEQDSNLPKLCCALCMTTAESIQTGMPFGCNHCYNVFEELLVSNLVSQDKLPSAVQKEIERNIPLPIHRGKSPEQPLTIPLSNEVATLSVALNDALKKEHYEQAAWLRDQIKELKEQTSGPQEQSPS